MNNIIILDDLEYWTRFCEFKQTSGSFRLFEFRYDLTNYPKVNGHFFYNGIDFVALYSNNKTIKFFYQHEYDIHKGLTIKIIDENSVNRIFIIEEYNIKIRYKKSKFIGLDCWSQETDVDLLYKIYKNYKQDDFYDNFIKKYGQ